jgi:type IV pilus assembly protein PilM
VRSTASPSWIRRAAGLDPLPVPPHVFALGRRELRYACFARRRGEDALELTEMAAVPLAETVLGSGPLGAPLADPEALKAALAQLLARLGGKVERASLVLPDAWARAFVVELGDLPDEEPQRSEVLRFKLKRLVPFRVDELRVAAAPLAPLPGQQEPVRVLVAFAAESLCGALERVFAERGIRLGQITGSTQPLLEAVTFHGRLPGLTAVALVQPEGVALVFARDGEPVVWRQKSFTEGLADADRARLLAAELKLTRTFLAERVGEERPAQVVLAAPREVEPFWREVLAAGLGDAPLALASEHLPLAGEGLGPAVAQLAPMLGAACREVS